MKQLYGLDLPTLPPPASTSTALVPTPAEGLDQAAVPSPRKRLLSISNQNLSASSTEGPPKPGDATSKKRCVTEEIEIIDLT